MSVARRSTQLPLFVTLLAGCSFTSIPDVTSEWSEPCDTSVRTCPLRLTMTATNERTVELRGDFRDGGWVAGVPMALVDKTWSTTIPVGWGAAVQYKFFIDGTTWRLDPANARTIDDGHGNTNSLIESVSCPKWTCLAH